MVEYRVRLGGVPLERRAGFALIALRLRQLLRNEEAAWEEIERDEAGSFWLLFRKYHVPLLFPLLVVFLLHELSHFQSPLLFARHLLLFIVLGGALYCSYIFLLGAIAEEMAEHAGGRFLPQSGTRVAIFSTLILSFVSVAFFLPIFGKLLVVWGFFRHYRQLLQGSRVLLHIPEQQYKLYCLSHAVLWLVLGLAGFFVLSLVSFLSSKFGFTAI
ncbi:MAG: hypothetical protein N2Z22_00575 [Turneriella sp.]|nr:hypothetical protein [Turneriella sp.]